MATSFAIRANPRTFIIPDLSTNKIARFTKDQVALVYGSSGSSVTSPKLAMIITRTRAMGRHQQSLAPLFRSQRRRLVGAVLSSDNMQRPTGPTCDGCHSVGYDIQHQKSRRVERPAANAATARQRARGAPNARQYLKSRAHGLRPGQRQPAFSAFPGAAAHQSNRRQILRLARRLSAGFKPAGLLEAGGNKLGETTFTHFPDGTAHKNRMQGNDFVQSVM